MRVYYTNPYDKEKGYFSHVVGAPYAIFKENGEWFFDNKTDIVSTNGDAYDIFVEEGDWVESVLPPWRQ